MAFLLDWEVYLEDEEWLDLRRQSYCRMELSWQVSFCVLLVLVLGEEEDCEKGCARASREEEEEIDVVIEEAMMCVYRSRRREQLETGE